MRHILFLCLLMIWLPVSAQDRIEQAIDTSEQTTRESARSQARIDQLDDETRRKLEAYRQAIWERQQLEVYSEQLEELQRIQVQDVTRLREGLVAMYILTLDGGTAAIWDHTLGQWSELPATHRSMIRQGIRIAREVAAPELLELPVPAPGHAEDLS